MAEKYGDASIHLTVDGGGPDKSGVDDIPEIFSVYCKTLHKREYLEIIQDNFC